jgi:hypothetical protein
MQKKRLRKSHAWAPLMYVHTTIIAQGFLRVCYILSKNKKGKIITKITTKMIANDNKNNIKHDNINMKIT